MAPLRQLAVDRGWWVGAAERSARDSGQGDPPRPMTHVFLDGGRLSVWPPSDELDREFASAYAQELISRRPTYLVERTLRGGTYRFFADFDIKGPSRGCGDTGDTGDTGNSNSSAPQPSLEAIVLESMAGLPEDLRRGSIAVCVRTTTADDGKRGAHLIWDDSARVTDAEALELRDAWVARLGGGRWEDVIDAAVYRCNGLRMPWALKGSRMSSVESWYVPALQIAWRGGEWSSEPIPEAPDRTTLIELVARCSIRARPSSMAPPRTPALGRPNPSDLAAIESIEQAVAAYWGEGVARSLRRCSAGSTGACAVYACNSRRCFIKGGEHRGNHVYFTLRPCVNRCYAELSQHCHSERCRDSFVRISTIRLKNVQGR